MSINKSVIALVILSCVFSLISAYELIELYYSSISPSENHTIKFYNYQLNFSKDSINAFKEKINKDFFDNDYQENNSLSRNYKHIGLEQYNTKNTEMQKNSNTNMNNNEIINDKNYSNKTDNTVVNFSNMLNDNLNNKESHESKHFNCNNNTGHNNKQHTNDVLNNTASANKRDYSVQELHNTNHINEFNNSNDTTGSTNSNRNSTSVQFSDVKTESNSSNKINTIVNSNPASIKEVDNSSSRQCSDNTSAKDLNNNQIVHNKTNFDKYYYSDYYYFKRKIIRLTNIVKKFDEEITNNKYLKNDTKIKEITKVFKDILDKITEDLYKSKIYISKYKERELASIIPKAEYLILSASSYLHYLLRTLTIIFVSIILILIEIRLNKK